MLIIPFCNIRLSVQSLEGTYEFCENYALCGAIGLSATPAFADQLVTSVLPTSRSTVLGKSVTVFSTVINAGGALTNCRVGNSDSSQTSVTYQLTDPATNAVTSGQNPSFDLAAGASQSMVLTIQPSIVEQAATVAPVVTCLSGSTDVTSNSIDGINTILFSANNQATPDVIALVASPTGDGVLHIQGQGANAFAVAVANVGSAGAITASVDTGSLPLALTTSICQTGSDGQCAGSAGTTASLQLPANGTASFAVFVQATGELPFSPATARIFVRLSDATQAVRGATSVAVTNNPVASATLPKGGIFAVNYPASSNSTALNSGALFIAEDGEIQGLDGVGNVLSAIAAPVGSDLAFAGAALYQPSGSFNLSALTIAGVLSQANWFSAEVTSNTPSAVTTGPASFWLGGAYQASAYERPSSLSLPSGAWKLRDSGGNLIGTAKFASNGSYSGTISGCPFTGTIKVIDARYDLYHMEFVTSCISTTIVGNDFTGLAALVDDQSTNDTLLFFANETATGGSTFLPFSRN